MNRISARHRVGPALLLVASSLALSACMGGGGGGGGPAFVAPPPPPPPPTTPPPTTPPPTTPPPAQATSVKIFATPTVGDYASVGVSIAGPGGNLDTYTSADTRFGTVSTDPADQAHIRYTSGGYYEVKLAGADWDRLVPYKGMSGFDPELNNYFQPESVPQNYGYVVTSNSRNSGYQYSELAGWGSSAEERWGKVAFGLPTPAGGVPTSGGATFNGMVRGNADVMLPDHLYGGYYALWVGGDVTLNFDFGSGTLGGVLNLYADDDFDPVALGSFAFKETVFSVGSQTYSGKFDTAATTGQNFFLGQFTGPNAEETIGAWAVPFIYNVNGTYLKGDGQVHQAFGAWIAKRQP